MTETQAKPRRTAEILVMWDQDVTEVQGVSPERIVAAVQAAKDAFWASIAAAFPACEYGDMAPGDELAFEWASNTVVMTWLSYNHPGTDTRGWLLSTCCGAPLNDEDEMYLVCDTCGQPTGIKREWPTRGE